MNELPEANVRSDRLVHTHTHGHTKTPCEHLVRKPSPPPSDLTRLGQRLSMAETPSTAHAAPRRDAPSDDPLSSSRTARPERTARSVSISSGSCVACSRARSNATTRANITSKVTDLQFAPLVLIRNHHISPCKCPKALTNCSLALIDHASSLHIIGHDASGHLRVPPHNHPMKIPVFHAVEAFVPITMPFSATDPPLHIACCMLSQQPTPQFCNRRANIGGGRVNRGTSRVAHESFEFLSHFHSQPPIEHFSPPSAAQ